MKKNNMKIFNILRKNAFTVKDLKYEKNDIKKEYNTGFDLFNIVYFINLDHRTDRLQNIENELSKTNINKEKIKRIQGIFTGKNGTLGCAMSHCKVLEEFLKTPENIKNCVIFEDDFIFTENQESVNKLINNFFKEIGDDYDVLMLSSYLLDTVNVNENILKINAAQTLSGYVVNKRYAEKLLNNFKVSVHMLYEVDVHMKILQKTDKWYCLNPKIGKQKTSYSDIQKKIVKYSV